MSLVDKRLTGHPHMWREGTNNPLGMPVHVNGSPTEGEVNGHSVILAGTNNYLGLTFHPDCMRAAEQALHKYGTGTTGARLANGTYEDHLLLESELADFYCARSALIFTTGYQANLGIITGLADHSSILLLDADCHASIYDAARMSGAEIYRFRHNNPEDLAKKLKRLGPRTQDTLVVTEGIYSMLGDIAPLQELCEVTKRSGATLLVDEAHSFGVLGKSGRGLAEELGVEDQIDFVVGTFSKSLGSVGGYCISKAHDLNLLKQSMRPFIFSASMVPSAVASSRAALRVIQKEPELREKLWHNAHKVFDAFQSMGFETGPFCSPVVAVIIRNMEDILNTWNFLLEQGVYVNMIAPPAAPGNYCLLRCSLSAAHSEQQVDSIIEAYGKIAQLVHNR